MTSERSKSAEGSNGKTAPVLLVVEQLESGAILDLIVAAQAKETCHIARSVS